MLSYNNINGFGERLQTLRYERFQNNPEQFKYCKSQEEFVAEMSTLYSDAINSRQVLAKWEHGDTEPNLSHLAVLCDLLDCDPNYLLGYQSTFNKTDEEIAAYTGLERKHITSLHRDHNLSDFINQFVFSEKFIELYHYLNVEFYNGYIGSDLESHFNENLLKLMNAALKTTIKNTTVFDDRSKFYRKELYNKISSEKYSDFLDGAVSPDYKNQIQIQLEEQRKQGNNISEYDVFINMIAGVSFEPLLYNYEKDLRMGRLSQMFIEITKDYFEQRRTMHKGSIRKKLRSKNK